MAIGNCQLTTGNHLLRALRVLRGSTPSPSGQFHQLQRERLDEAFDADVRDRAELSADWVIEHRKAYSAAMDVLNRQRSASDQADAVTRRNLDAMNEAMKRLLDLQSIQLKLMPGRGDWDSRQ